MLVANYPATPGAANSSVTATSLSAESSGCTPSGPLLKAFSRSVNRLWQCISQSRPSTHTGLVSTSLLSQSRNCAITPQNTTLILQLLGRVDPESRGLLAEALAGARTWNGHPDVFIRFFQANTADELPAASQLLENLDWLNPSSSSLAAGTELNRIIDRKISPMMTVHRSRGASQVHCLTDWMCSLFGQTGSIPAVESLRKLNPQLLKRFEKMLRKLPAHLKSTRQKQLLVVIRKALMINKIVQGDFLQLQDNYHQLDRALQQDTDVLIALCASSGEIYELIAPELRANRDVALAAMGSYGDAYSEVPEPLRSDREIILTAVRNNGLALHYASAEFMNDKEIVIEAVKSEGMILRSLSYTMRSDRDVVLHAVQNNGSALLYAHEKLRSDYEVCKAAVMSCPNVMFLLSEELHNDRSIMMAAVERNGDAINCGLHKWKGDLQLVLTAVSQNGENLRFASEELKNRHEVCLAAVRQTPDAFQYVGDSMKKDPTIRAAAGQEDSAFNI